MNPALPFISGRARGDPDEARVTTARWYCGFHEAGHAAAYLYFGYAFDHAEIYEDGGRVAVSRAGRRPDPLTYAVIALAGPVAEARYASVSVTELLRGVSRIDHQHAQDALARLDPVPEFAEIVGGAIGLVVTEWPRVGRIARELVSRGRLDYAEVARL
jgi:hypothetical protein